MFVDADLSETVTPADTSRYTVAIGNPDDAVRRGGGRRLHTSGADPARES